MLFVKMMAILIQVKGVKADCIDKETVQIKIGDDIKIGHALSSLLTVNDKH